MERYNSANSGQLVKHGETTGSFDIAPSPPLLLGVRSTILHLSSATNMVKNGDTRNPQDHIKQHETTWKYETTWNNQLHPSATSACYVGHWDPCHPWLMTSSLQVVDQIDPVLAKLVPKHIANLHGSWTFTMQGGCMHISNIYSNIISVSFQVLSSILGLHRRKCFRGSACWPSLPVKQNWTIKWPDQS